MREAESLCTKLNALTRLSAPLICFSLDVNALNGKHIASQDAQLTLTVLASEACARIVAKERHPG